MLPSTKRELTHECERERELKVEGSMPRSILVGLKEILAFGESDSVMVHDIPGSLQAVLLLIL